MRLRQVATIATAVLALFCPRVGRRTILVDLAPSLARLVPFDDLQERLGEPHLRILDARSKSDYDAGHIPGAIWVNVKSAEKVASSAEGLQDRSAWERWIEPLGLGRDSEVIIYDAQRQLSAARTWWLLSYLGVEKVALIDGGFPLWVKQGHRSAGRSRPSRRVRSRSFSARLAMPRERMSCNPSNRADTRSSNAQARTSIPGNWSGRSEAVISRRRVCSNGIPW